MAYYLIDFENVKSRGMEGVNCWRRRIPSAFSTVTMRTA